MRRSSDLPAPSGVYCSGGLGDGGGGITSQRRLNSGGLVNRWR